MSFSKEVWNTLSAINVNEHVQKKMNLSFLSWSWAWSELMAVYPESTYAIEDSVTASDGSVEVWVSLTITDGDSALTRRMWLPVMDHKNNAIKSPTTRQISDARMRCLVKAMAMFGLGHYIYAGEDLPEAEKSPAPTIEEQINSAMSRDDLADLWRQMTAKEKTNNEAAFVERSKHLEKEA